MKGLDLSPVPSSARFICLLLLLVLRLTTSANDVREEQLIGWQGETYKPEELTSTNDAARASRAEESPWIQTISWQPRAQVYHHFLSDAEAKHVLDIAKYQMKRSLVVGPNDTGLVDSVRTSAGMFVRRNFDPVITAIDQRLAVWSKLPPEHQEDMQVLRYGPTNKYGPHIDGLERVMSVLIYLVAPEEGGETAFVNSQWSHPELARAAGKLSPCAAGHVAYKPKRGDALLFYDMTADYLGEDGHSMHTGCPVIKGIKWNAVKWIHGKPFREDEYKSGLNQPAEEPLDPGQCRDEHPSCKMWADAGECTKNPGYMVGKNGGQGACRKACNDCTECAPRDQACLDENRRRGGYMVVEEAEFGF